MARQVPAVNWEPLRGRDLGALAVLSLMTSSVGNTRCRPRLVLPLFAGSMPSASSAAAARPLALAASSKPVKSVAACEFGATARGDLKAKTRMSRDMVRTLSRDIVRFGGAKGTRTPDLLTASQTRYQLRHSPKLLRKDSRNRAQPRNRLGPA